MRKIVVMQNSAWDTWRDRGSHHLVHSLRRQPPPSSRSPDFPPTPPSPLGAFSSEDFSAFQEAPPSRVVGVTFDRGAFRAALALYEAGNPYVEALRCEADALRRKALATQETSFDRKREVDIRLQRLLAKAERKQKKLRKRLQAGPDPSGDGPLGSCPVCVGACFLFLPPSPTPLHTFIRLRPTIHRHQMPCGKPREPRDRNSF